MSGRYGDFRDQFYDHYISEQEWVEKILDGEINQNNGEKLFKDLEVFLSEEYNLSTKGSPSEVDLKLAEVLRIDKNQNKKFEKAKEFLFSLINRKTGRNNSVPEKIKRKPPIIQESNRNLVLSKVVESAQKKGYLEEFRLAGPWHPKNFYEGDLVTYLYQHNTAVTYRGISRKYMYKANAIESDSERSAKHKVSILNSGHLKRGSHVGEEERNYIWTTPSLKNARNYARNTNGKSGLVLELQIPTKWMIFGAKNDAYIAKNLNEMHEIFGTPEKFREHLLENWNSEQISFRVDHDLPIEYIKGVWDTETDQEPNFYPLYSKKRKDIIEVMREIEPKKIPRKSDFQRDLKHSDSIVRRKEKIRKLLEEKYYKPDHPYFSKLIRSITHDKKELSYYEVFELVILAEKELEDLESDLSKLKNPDSTRDLETTISETERKVSEINKAIKYLSSLNNVKTQVISVESLKQAHRLVRNNINIFKNQKGDIENFKKKIENNEKILRESYSKDKKIDLEEAEINFQDLNSLIRNLKRIKIEELEASLELKDKAKRNEVIKAAEKVRKEILSYKNYVNYYKQITKIAEKEGNTKGFKQLKQAEETVEVSENVYIVGYGELEFINWGALEPQQRQKMIIRCNNPSNLSNRLEKADSKIKKVEEELQTLKEKLKEIEENPQESSIEELENMYEETKKEFLKTGVLVLDES